MVSTAAAPTAIRTRQRVAAIVAHQRQEAERARLVRRLASALLQLLHIPSEEAALVAWLGNNDCRCNAEAARAWIKTELEDPELACSTFNVRILLAALMHRLQRRLFAIEDTLE